MIVIYVLHVIVFFTVFGMFGVSYTKLMRELSKPEEEQSVEIIEDADASVKFALFFLAFTVWCDKHCVLRKR